MAIGGSSDELTKVSLLKGVGEKADELQSGFSKKAPVCIRTNAKQQFKCEQNVVMANYSA